MGKNNSSQGQPPYAIANTGAQDWRDEPVSTRGDRYHIWGGV